MIATLNGTVSEKIGSVIVLEVAGVGYGVLVTTEEYGRLATGDKTRFYIYESIREQAHDLYGFSTLGSKALFEQLLDVQGVGPKMALNVLSVGNSDAVKQAIAGGDVKFIQQASGVGKRVAERIVVDLKDKVGLAGIDLQETSLLHSETNALQDEAVQALVALGYTPADAATALKNIDDKLPTEERIKQALAS